MDVKDSEIQRSYNVANADVLWYEECIREHRKNLEFAESCLQKALMLKKACEAKAKDYGVELINITEKKL